jgi:hypothetical protein
MHSRDLRSAGEPDERIFAVAARATPYFSDAERARAGADRGVHQDQRSAGPRPGRDLNVAIAQPSGEWLSAVRPEAA